LEPTSWCSTFGSYEANTRSPATIELSWNAIGDAGMLCSATALQNKFYFTGDYWQGDLNFGPSVQE
jgi:hypothetical protein